MTGLRATYRVQLRPGFGFDEAAAPAGYLAELGVSHLYSSPCFQATPGSTHGYGVVDPTRVNEELGGAAGHARLVEALRRHGLGLVLTLGGDWQETAVEIPGGAWRNEITGDRLAGGRVRLAALLARFPVALLERQGP